MDSLHSDSKFKSDFSIKRILGDDAQKREDTPSPSWLCCTRYRPPRLTRTPSSGCRARRSGRHARVPFTAAQAAALEAAYARAPYLAPPALRALAAALQLRDDRIKIWFQNRRARERKEKSINITPPQAVTLPPTSSPNTTVTSLNTPWTHQTLLSSNSAEVNQSIISTRQRFRNSVASNDISLVSSNILFKSEEKHLEDRCDSPLDVET